MRGIVVVLLALLVTGFVAVSADQNNGLMPKLPDAKGERCVEPTEIMRRRHMDFILHQRDLTVHEGIRTEKYRFTKCIDCHIQPGDDGTYPRHTSSDHFCTACHEFASVAIDCFQCHADRPAAAFKVSAAADAGPSFAVNRDLLEVLARLRRGDGREADDGVQ